MPALPALGAVVLVRVAGNLPRPAARQGARVVLRHILAAWSGPAVGSQVLNETARGPVWSGELAGHSLDISLAYTESAAWIGLRRGGAIGVDAMTVAAIPEAVAVAKIYLGPEAWTMIQGAADPVRAFAEAWTALEARLKCRKLALTEWPANQDPAGGSGLVVRHYTDQDQNQAVCVVTEGGTEKIVSK
jgi:4'-phosphopantetheinyl transferase